MQQKCSQDSNAVKTDSYWCEQSWLRSGVVPDQITTNLKDHSVPDRTRYKQVELVRNGQSEWVRTSLDESGLTRTSQDQLEPVKTGQNQSPKVSDKWKSNTRTKEASTHQSLMLKTLFITSKQLVMVVMNPQAELLAISFHWRRRGWYTTGVCFPCQKHTKNMTTRATCTDWAPDSDRGKG